MGRLQFCLFGDSITEMSYELGGWGARLTSLYARQADVFLRGYAGYNSRWAKELLDSNFPDIGRLTGTEWKSHDLVTVWFGANDAVLSDRNGKKQHVPIDEYKLNLSEILKRLQSVSKYVLLITPPPINEEKRIRQIESEVAQSGKEMWLPERTQEKAAKYAEAAKETAELCGVPILDVYGQLMQLPNWEALQDDGLHFNSAGQTKVFDLLVEALWEHFPLLRLNGLRPDQPPHEAIDAEDHQQSFRAYAATEQQTPS